MHLVHPESLTASINFLAPRTRRMTHSKTCSKPMWRNQWNWKSIAQRHCAFESWKLFLVICGVAKGFWGPASDSAVTKEPMRMSGMFWWDTSSIVPILLKCYDVQMSESSNYSIKTACIRHTLCRLCKQWLNMPLKDVEPHSPAALAGLQAHLDYIVGADQVLQDVSDECMLSPFIKFSTSDFDTFDTYYWSALLRQPFVFNCDCNCHSLRTSFPWLSPVRGNPWNFLCTTARQMSAGRWWSPPMVPGVERAGESVKV